ncbi:MAG: RHS repeat protein [Dehalococcoidia bacterium]|nr:RHS repeat protein [Dehalococcoidia bacterium]
MPRRDIGRRTSITYPGGSNQVTYGYDNANRLTSVTDWNSNSTTYSYDDAGRMTTTTLPSGTVAIDTEGCEVGNVGCHERARGIPHGAGPAGTHTAELRPPLRNRDRACDHRGTAFDAGCTSRPSGAKRRRQGDRA